MSSLLQIDELDYEARLGAYRQLTVQKWRQLAHEGAAALLLGHALADLRNPDDLALRHAAAQALDRFLENLRPPARGRDCLLHWRAAMQDSIYLLKRSRHCPGLNDLIVST